MSLSIARKSRSARARAGERVRAIANFFEFQSSFVLAELKGKLFLVAMPETSTRDACATLSPRGMFGFGFAARAASRPKNRFAFFHQIETIARNRFQIGRVKFLD